MWRQDVERSHFLQAVILSCQAVIEYARRYSALAQEMAERCTDAARKEELLRIAENCSRVPAKGAPVLKHVSPSGLFSS